MASLSATVHTLKSPISTATIITTAISWTTAPILGATAILRTIPTDTPHESPSISSSSSATYAMVITVLPTQCCNDTTKERGIEKKDRAYSCMDMDFHSYSHDSNSDRSNRK